MVRGVSRHGHLLYWRPLRRLPSLRSVIARRARWPVFPGALAFSRANSPTDLPAALAWAVNAPGFFIAPAMKFFLRLAMTASVLRRPRLGRRVHCLKFLLKIVDLLLEAGDGLRSR